MYEIRKNKKVSCNINIIVGIIIVIIEKKIKENHNFVGASL